MPTTIVQAEQIVEDAKTDLGRAILRYRARAKERGERLLSIDEILGEPPDRSDAVNLARNLQNNPALIATVTPAGVKKLSDGILRMDEWISNQRRQL